MSFLKTAFFVKNVPGWERAVRGVLALAAVAIGLTVLRSPWSWLVAVSGAGFGMTGVLGFCPACALVGRRLARVS
jgi:hypothetical protein